MTQRIVSDVYGLNEQLPLELPRDFLIAIDGVGGAGKSTVGAHLEAIRDGLKHIDLDKFLIAETGAFVAALRVDELRAAIAAASGGVVLSGICMLEVLEHVQRRANILVYVKRMARWGWADQEEVEGPQPEPALDIELEVWTYHQKYQPQAAADVVVERQEDRN